MLPSGLPSLDGDVDDLLLEEEELRFELEEVDLAFCLS